VDWYSSAEEAEPEAMKEGIFLTLNWVAGPVVSETDCAEVVEAINQSRRIKTRMASNQVTSLSC
jgi:hypothetical protein